MEIVIWKNSTTADPSKKWAFRFTWVSSNHLECMCILQGNLVCSVGIGLRIWDYHSETWGDGTRVLALPWLQQFISRVAYFTRKEARLKALICNYPRNPWHDSWGSRVLLPIFFIIVSLEIYLGIISLQSKTSLVNMNKFASKITSTCNVRVILLTPRDFLSEMGPLWFSIIRFAYKMNNFFPHVVHAQR